MFNRLGKAGVDILWVVDNSSMFEEQEQLGAHTAHFTDYLTRSTG